VRILGGRCPVRRGRHIDYGMAWKGALFLAVIVWLINLEH
jgi:hypothetical protein